jgi:hypothetical protein
LIRQLLCSQVGPQRQIGVPGQALDTDTPQSKAGEAPPPWKGQISLEPSVIGGGKDRRYRKPITRRTRGYLDITQRDSGALEAAYMQFDIQLPQTDVTNLQRLLQI